MCPKLAVKPDDERLKVAIKDNLRFNQGKDNEELKL